MNTEILRVRDEVLGWILREGDDGQVSNRAGAVCVALWAVHVGAPGSKQRLIRAVEAWRDAMRPAGDQ